MQYTADAVNVAIEELSKLPGIGRKSAQRLVFFLLKSDKEEIKSLATALLDLKEKIQFCETCFNFADSSQCAICASPSRNHKIICVVEEANDVLAIERTNEYHGTYHILGGFLSPLDGIGPDDLKIRELMIRLNDEIEEVILATNASAEGEATAVYLSKFIKPLEIKISRIARGIPMGGDLEYTDEVTLARALSERVGL
ncbi:MAG: recombination protein RecR [Calditrichaeota bacterium]|nr:MAG: recombination protein RecR [Calditrichota bacterium]